MTPAYFKNRRLFDIEFEVKIVISIRNSEITISVGQSITTDSANITFFDKISIAVPSNFVGYCI